MYTGTAEDPGITILAPTRERAAQQAYQMLGGLFVLCVVGQLVFVGLSLFVTPSWWRWHKTFGHLFGLVLLPVMLVAAYIGRMSRRARLAPVVTLVLFLVQGGLAAMGGTVGALHPMNALILFWVSLKMARLQ